jgi:DNA repair exonuclease SbcCD nuclease subunit
MHQCVEGATVGPGNYTFTTAADVIRGRDVPAGFSAVLSGHIHRHQVLTTDLRGRPLGAPVLYPGSIERTSIAEADEDKGYMMVEVACDESGSRVDWQFRRLPARPLVRRDLRIDRITDEELEPMIRSFVAEAPTDAVLTIRVVGSISEHAARVLSAANLRGLAPPSMNIELRMEEGSDVHVRPTGRSKGTNQLLDLPLFH